MDYTFEKIVGSKIIDKIKKIRYDVFVKEDNYPIEAITSDYDNVATHFIAKKNDNIVGTITVAQQINSLLPIEKFFPLDKYKNCPIVEIQKLAVLPDERKGFVSLALMVLAYEHAKSLNAKKIVIFSLANKKENINLYKKFGFEIVGTFQFYDVGKALALILDIDSNAVYEQSNKNARRQRLVDKIMELLDL